MVLAPPARRILEAAHEAAGGLSRERAAQANGSRLTTADDYLRALARLGFLQRERSGRGVAYHLTDAGRALIERRPYVL